MILFPNIVITLFILIIYVYHIYLNLQIKICLIVILNNQITHFINLIFLNHEI